METLLTTSPEAAARFIRRGEIVAFPTETVYGLGADAFDADAVQRIFDAKGRPADNPLITHIADRAQIPELTRSVPAPAATLIDRFFPGPLTLILPRHPHVPPIVTAGLDTIGIRMPDDPLALRFLSACGTSIAAPSANRSGRPSPTTWQAVHDDLGGRIPCILKGGRSRRGLESTVVDCTRTPPVTLRPGAISLEALQMALPDIGVAAPEANTPARSPGTKYRHYAPSAEVHLVSSAADAVPASSHAYIGLEEPLHPEAFGRVHVSPSVEDYAHALFHFFRQSDAAGCRVIFCQTPPSEGLGRALTDRLQRAAAATEAS